MLGRQAMSNGATGVNMVMSLLFATLQAMRSM